MAKSVKIGSEKKTVTVEIGEKKYAIPLAGSMKRKELANLRNAAKEGDEMTVDDAVYEIFCKYIPTETLDDMTMDEYKQLVDTWTNANEATEGTTLGES
ncbi:MAG: hypothetical protein IJ188_08345 [Clostridia bacterium]|nr:hypothetical protein [Clostridia bacterium]